MDQTLPEKAAVVTENWLRKQVIHSLLKWSFFVLIGPYAGVIGLIEGEHTIISVVLIVLGSIAWFSIGVFVVYCAISGEPEDEGQGWNETKPT